MQSIADQICIVENGRNFYQGPIESLLDSVCAIQSVSSDVTELEIPGFLLQRPELILKDSMAKGRRQLIISCDDASYPERSFLHQISESEKVRWESISLSFEEVLVALLQRR